MTNKTHIISIGYRKVYQIGITAESVNDAESIVEDMLRDKGIGKLEALSDKDVTDYTDVLIQFEETL